MPERRLRLLVVDDDPSLRESFLVVFRHLGYEVDSAEDGFSALSEMRNKLPDILLADLNMPGMSGFELLSVVRRRFPQIPVIAMSGAFSGSEVPSGVAADGFYQKGGGMDRLLRTITVVQRLEKPIRVETPIWISQNGYDSSGKPYVTIACP
jgi:CheY-like chemotaxis protein